MKIFLHIYVALILSACGGEFVETMKFNVKEWSRNANLANQFFGDALTLGVGGPPEGASPIYQAGWWDGCKSGAAAYGNDFLKSSYSFYQNPEYVDNLEYYKAWKDTYNYCRYHVGFYTAFGL